MKNPLFLPEHEKEELLERLVNLAINGEEGEVDMTPEGLLSLQGRELEDCDRSGLIVSEDLLEFDPDLLDSVPTLLEGLSEKRISQLIAGASLSRDEVELWRQNRKESLWNQGEGALACVYNIRNRAGTPIHVLAILWGPEKGFQHEFFGPYTAFDDADSEVRNYGWFSGWYPPLAKQNPLVMRTAEIPVYSPTRLNIFEQCPQRYKFKYVDRATIPEFISIEAFVGSRVHEVLNKLYAEMALGMPHPLEVLVEFYVEQWRKVWGPNVHVIRSDKTEQEYFDYGLQCIRNYYARFYPFKGSETIKTEARILFPLDSQKRFRIQGFVDRIGVEPNGAWEIHDYKTSRRKPTQNSLDKDRQLGLYQLGLMWQYEDVRVVNLVWHYVGLNLEFHSRRSAEQLDDLIEDTLDLIERIETNTEFPPARSPLCNWCEYKSICPLWQ